LFHLRHMKHTKPMPETHKKRGFEIPWRAGGRERELSGGARHPCTQLSAGGDVFFLAARVSGGGPLESHVVGCLKVDG